MDCDICAKCKDHAGFEDVDGEMLSECCGESAYRADGYEPHEFDPPESSE